MDGSENLISLDEIGLGIAHYAGFHLRSAFQPVFCRFGHKLVPVGLEGLARPTREGTAVSPTDFFHAVPAADRAFVDALCQLLHLRNWRFAEPAGLRLFLNADVGHAETTATLAERLRATVRGLGDEGIALSLIVCELGNAHRADHLALTRLAGRLRSFGLRIAMDFADAPGNLRNIEMVAPDIVKVDGGWFRRVCEERAALRLLPRLFESLQTGGGQVLVQGVETQAQIEHAVDAGAQYLQGFALGMPALAGADVQLRPRYIRPPAISGDNVVVLAG